MTTHELIRHIRILQATSQSLREGAAAGDRVKLNGELGIILRVEAIEEIASKVGNVADQLVQLIPDEPIPAVAPIVNESVPV